MNVGFQVMMTQKKAVQFEKKEKAYCQMSKGIRKGGSVKCETGH